jgi:hypothetical protein
MREEKLIDGALEALQTLGFQAEFQPNGANLFDRGVGDRIRLRRGKVRLEYVAETKRNVTPATIGAITEQLRRLERKAKKPGLLIAEYVTAETAETIRTLGHQFIDAAGNAYLEGHGLYILVVGRRPGQQLPKRTEGRAFTPTGVKAVFAFLCDPELVKAPLRTIAETADVALGALPGIFADLERRGHLAVAGRNRRLVATKRLLDEWAMAYAAKTRPATLLVATEIEGFRDWNLHTDRARWGGEAAAALLTDHLRPGKLLIYAAERPVKLIVERRLRAPAVPGNGNVELRVPIWPQVLAAPGPRADVTPVPLVYADLLAVRDARCLETAGVVYEKYLARLFPKD